MTRAVSPIQWLSIASFSKYAAPTTIATMAAYSSQRPPSSCSSDATRRFGDAATVAGIFSDGGANGCSVGRAAAGTVTCVETVSGGTAAALACGGGGSAAPAVE